MNNNCRYTRVIPPIFFQKNVVSTANNDNITWLRKSKNILLFYNNYSRIIFVMSRTSLFIINSVSDIVWNNFVLPYFFFSDWHLWYRGAIEHVCAIWLFTKSWLPWFTLRQVYIKQYIYRAVLHDEDSISGYVYRMCSGCSLCGSGWCRVLGRKWSGIRLWTWPSWREPDLDGMLHILQSFMCLYYEHSRSS